MTVRGPTIKFSNGIEMPLVGFGTWQVKPEEVGAEVEWALNCGYRLIDAAHAYQNEKEIGIALHKFFQCGKLKREDVFVITKFFPTEYHPGRIEEMLRVSLKDLQLDYVDLYLVHLPTAFKGYDFRDNSRLLDPDVTVEDMWKGMEEVYAKGLTKSIGVSNFSQQQMERILKNAKTPIHNLHAECHIYFPQFELHEFCKKHGISFTAFAPLGSPNRLAAVGSGEPTPKPLEDEVVKKLAAKYHKTCAQILIRYLLQRNISPIPKSVHENRIKENFDIFDFQLTDGDMKELNNVKHRQRFFMLPLLAGHPEDPWKNERKK